MKKENSVIKNYIFSPDTRILSDENRPAPTEILKYRLSAGQNKDFLYLFLLQK